MISTPDGTRTRGFAVTGRCFNSSKRRKYMWVDKLAFGVSCTPYLIRVSCGLPHHASMIRALLPAALLWDIPRYLKVCQLCRSRGYRTHSGLCRRFYRPARLLNGLHSGKMADRALAISLRVINSLKTLPCVSCSLPLRNNNSALSALEWAPVPGFEPGYNDYKSLVLPLDETGI